MSRSTVFLCININSLKQETPINVAHFDSPHAAYSSSNQLIIILNRGKVWQTITLIYLPQTKEPAKGFLPTLYKE